MAFGIPVRRNRPWPSQVVSPWAQDDPTFAPGMGRPVSRSRTIPSITRPGATVSSNLGPSSLNSAESSSGDGQRFVGGVAGGQDGRISILRSTRPRWSG